MFNIQVTTSPQRGLCLYQVGLKEYTKGYLGYAHYTRVNVGYWNNMNLDYKLFPTLWICFGLFHQQIHQSLTECSRLHNVHEMTTKQPSDGRKSWERKIVKEDMYLYLSHNREIDKPLEIPKDINISKLKYSMLLVFMQVEMNPQTHSEQPS